MAFLPRLRVTDFSQEINDLHQSAADLQVKPRQVAGGLDGTSVPKPKAVKPGSFTGSDYRKR